MPSKGVEGDIPRVVPPGQESADIEKLLEEGGQGGHRFSEAVRDLTRDSQVMGRNTSLDPDGPLQKSRHKQ